MSKKRAALVSFLLAIVMCIGLRSVASYASVHSVHESNSLIPHNIVLFYDDYPISGNPSFQVTKRIVEPLVAHVDERGFPTDFMFDSFIFYSYYLYSNSTPTHEYVVKWISYIFNGSQIANLDATVGDVKAAINRPDYRMNVFLTVPVAYTPPPYSAAMVPSTIANVETILATWNQLSLQNLRLVGFYWGFTEDLWDNIGSVIAPVASYIHSRGYTLLMIPYRSPSNSANWPLIHDLGVDYVTAQVDYHIDPTSNITDFDTVNNAITAGYVDGANIEIPLGGNPILCCGGDWKVNLQTYFQQAYQYHWYRNAVTTYYHGTAISEMGTNPTYRTAYETIYGYVRAVRDVIPTLTPTTTATSTSWQTTASITTSGSAPSINFEISVSPIALNLPQASSGIFSIMIQPLGTFTDAVSLTASSVPDGIQVSFSPNPVIPQPGRSTLSTATVTVLRSVSTGTYSFTILAASGPLTKQIDVMVNVSGCLIATATYGSELSPEVQFLRSFRDRQILQTFAGSSFMTTFNAWYYSFSPSVAQYISTHETAKRLMKGLLYPLMGILHFSSLTYSSLAFLPEFAALTSGIIAASLVALTYLTLPLSAILWFARPMPKNGSETRYRLFAGLLLALISVFLIAEVFALSSVMMVASTSIILCVLVVVAMLMSLRMIEALRRISYHYVLKLRHKA